MSNDPRLLVPVHLDALLVGADASSVTWADLTPDYDVIALIYATLGQFIMPPSFQTGGPLKPGAHLHWSLPDALTHGSEGQAVAVASLQEGRVSSIAVLNGGFGYVIPPQVVLSGGGGRDAAAEAIIADGVVTEIRVTQPGLGYDSAPTVIVDGSGVINYMSVPDRWMVMRLHIDTVHRAVGIKSWIVESNALTTPNFFGGGNPDSVTWPTLDSPVTPYMYLGRFYDYPTGASGPADAYQEGFQAVGPGDPAFATYYPNCRSAFGFYDTLTDLPAASSVSYLVCGWYGEPTENPLAGVQTIAQFSEKMAEFRWCLSNLPEGYPEDVVCAADPELGVGGASKVAEEMPVPNDILCHAMTYGMTWEGPTAQYPTGVPSGQPEMALGNSSVEAMAALVASKVPQDGGDPIGIEEILAAFQYGMLDRLQQPDGVLDLEIALHDSAFGKGNGANIWVVQRKQTDAAAVNEQQDFDPEVGNLLRELISAQNLADQLSATLASMQWETYSAWYKKLLLNLSPFQEGDPKRGHALLQGLQSSRVHILANRYRVPERLEPLAAALEAAVITPDQIIELLGRLDIQIADLKSQLAAAEVQVDETKQALETAIRQTMPDYELLQAPKPRFRTANDPIVLLSGPGIERVYRHGFDHLAGECGRLPCRVSGQTVSGIWVTPPGHDPQLVTQAQLAAYYSFPQGGPIPSDIPALLVEALLLDTSMSQLIALAAYQMVGVANPTQAQIETLAEAVRITQTTLWNPALYPAFFRKHGITTQDVAEATGVVGTVPAQMSVAPWSQPWNPLFLQWSVQWMPSYTQPDQIGFCNPADPDCDQKWIFGDVDYSWNTAFDPTQIQPNTAIYTGFTPMTPNAPENLAERLAVFLAEHPDSPYSEQLQEILEIVRNLNVISQGVNGFNDAMVMRLPTLQLPVIDLFNPEVGAMVARAIDQQNQVAPLPNNAYTPIRAGHFNFTRLWLVDSFGRVQVIYGSGLQYKPVISRAMQTPGEDFKTLAQFPPRLAQASRLDFKFLKAGSDAVPSNSDPATSPICGWVIPNYFDRSIMVYDALGNPKGSLQMLAGGMGPNGSGVRWTRVPGVDTPLGALPELDNQHLQRFVMGLLQLGADGGYAVAEFLEVAFKTLSTIVPSGGGAYNNALSVLIGRPLAVIRASLAIELDGLPAYDQSWAALETLYRTGRFETRGFTDVPFPVRLGDVRRIQDGLIGYFVGDDYRTFYAGITLDKPPETKAYVEYDNLVSLTANPAADPLMLTLVTDPRAPFHLVSDFLPARAINVPSYQIAQALANMDVTFRVGPLIADPTQLSIPLPQIGAGNWSFSFHPDVVTWVDGAELVNEEFKAQLPEQPYLLREGWLRLSEAFKEIKTKN